MELCTPRLLIRTLVAQDLDAYAALVADPAVMRFLSHDGEVHDRAQARNDLEECIAHQVRHGYARYAVCELQAPARLIGICGYRHLPDYLDLGWRYAPAHWGAGIATEAGAAVLAFGRRALGLRDTHTTALVDNRASLRVIEKLGFALRQVELIVPGLRSAHYVFPEA